MWNRSARARSPRSATPVRPRRTRLRGLPAVLETLEERCLLTITPVHVPTWVEQGPASIDNGQVEGLANTAVAGAVAGVAAAGACAQLAVGTDSDSPRASHRKSSVMGKQRRRHGIVGAGAPP